jgi:hypothetical protein
MEGFYVSLFSQTLLFLKRKKGDSPCIHVDNGYYF